MPKLVISLDDFSIITENFLKSDCQKTFKNLLPFIKPLTDYIFSLIEKHQTDCNIVEFFIGSYKQSAPLDRYNFSYEIEHAGRKTRVHVGSFFPIMMQLVDHIQNIFPKLSITLNKFLLADVYNQRNDGETFSNAIATQSAEQAHTVHDISMWSNIYAQIWLTSDCGKAESKSINFYVICEDLQISKELLSCFSHTHFHVPTSIILHFPTTNTAITQVYGTSNINFFWRETLLAIVTSGTKNIDVLTQENNTVTFVIKPDTHLNFYDFLYSNIIILRALKHCLETCHKDRSSTSASNRINPVIYQQLVTAVIDPVNTLFGKSKISETNTGSNSPSCKNTQPEPPIPPEFGVRHFPFFGRRSSPTTPPEVTPYITHLVQQLKDVPDTSKLRSHSLN